VAVLPALLLLGGAALADPQPQPQLKSADAATVGIGMICDTAEQAQRYAALRAKGEEINPAAMKVNTEAKNPQACGIAAVAYIPDATIATQPVGANLLKVVRINVIADYNGSAWHRVTGLIQYAVIETEGLSI
jgi:hypothetical protein